MAFMPVYSRDTQLYACFQTLFGIIQSYDPTAADALVKASLFIRFNCSAPAAAITINARRAPVEIVYGATAIRPAIEVDLPTDALHCLLLGRIRLSKAIGSDLVKLKGPVWKTLSLADIFHHAQRFYPEVLKENGLSTDCPDSVRV
jgi:hypothetical protein